MSYADGLLSTGERILHRTKQHPFIFVWGARWAILAVIIAGLSTWLGSNLDSSGISGSIKSVLGWITLILFVGGIAVFVWTALRYINQEYVLTNRRVIQVAGVLNRSATDSSLEKINDAVLNQSIFGRMFDFGDLTVLTASESGIERMRMLRSPIAFKKQMLDAKHEYEVAMEREGMAPSPPIRDASPAPVAAAAPSAADPEDVTDTLASLADLRDRGAISAAEYEAKKAELLDRL
jgi:uncharacterized membrane protein YdbT with pleckstrin-like domain